MKTSLFIGLTGKKGHGKTTATLKAIEVLESEGFVVIRHNFKDALVHTMSTKLNKTLALLGEHYNLTQLELFEQKPPLVRTLMQEVGTEIYRGIRDDWWVMEWYMKLFNLQRENESVEKLAVLTDDVRFLNEEAILKSKGGRLIRVVREGYEDSVATNHQSETEMDKIEAEYTITATNKEELEEKIYQLIKKITHD